MVNTDMQLLHVAILGMASGLLTGYAIYIHQRFDMLQHLAVVMFGLIALSLLFLFTEPIPPFAWAVLGVPFIVFVILLILRLFTEKSEV